MHISSIFTAIIGQLFEQGQVVDTSTNRTFEALARLILNSHQIEGCCRPILLLNGIGHEAMQRRLEVAAENAGLGNVRLD